MGRRGRIWGGGGRIWGGGVSMGRREVGYGEEG